MIVFKMIHFGGSKNWTEPSYIMQVDKTNYCRGFSSTNFFDIMRAIRSEFEKDRCRGEQYALTIPEDIAQNLPANTKFVLESMIRTQNLLAQKQKVCQTVETMGD